MIDLLLDPEKALDAIEKATKLVKRAVAVSNDIGGIAKALGTQVQARANAEAALDAAKSGNMQGNAFEIASRLEMAIFEAKRDEEHLKNTVFYPNHVDLYMRIKATEAEIKKGQLAAIKKAKIAAKLKKERQDEINEIVLACVIGAALLAAVGWGFWYFITHCTKNGCG